MKKPERSPDSSLLSCLRSHLTQELIDEVSRKGFAHLEGWGVLMPQDFKRLSRDHPGWQKRIGVDVTIPDDFLIPGPLTQPDEQTAQVIQFPLWQEEVRGSPNAILRSALFGAIKKGRRRYLEDEVLAASKGITIKYTGPRLDQGDMDVWEQCLHIARVQPLGTKLPISEKAFLKAIGRNTGKSDREWLRKTLTRLAVGGVEIENERYSYFGTMLHEYYRDKEIGRYFFVVNPKIAPLFDDCQWTRIDWNQRKMLSGKPLAQWIHGFYSTHANPFPYKVGTIKELCGSETKDLWKFRQQLKNALQEISKVTGWKMYVDENDCVVVVRPEKSLKN